MNPSQTAPKDKPSLLSLFLKMAFLSSSVWILCEVLGGLLFLAFGLRLWEYYWAPLFWDITSPYIWLIAWILMPPFFYAFDVWEKKQKQISVWKRMAFLVVVGCSAEILINELIFRNLFDSPLYIYTFLPTFDGSGSLLSPFYYLTLYIHFPLNQKILGTH